MSVPPGAPECSWPGMKHIRHAGLSDRAGSVPRRGAKARQDPPFIEPEETLLIRPNLVDVQMIIAGVDERLNSRHVPLGIGAACDHLRHLLLADHAHGLLEMGRRG